MACRLERKDPGSPQQGRAVVEGSMPPFLRVVGPPILDQDRDFEQAVGQFEVSACIA